MKIKCDLNNISDTVKQLRELSFKDKERKLRELLSERGQILAQGLFERAQYDGRNDVIVTAQVIDENKHAVVADGNAVKFIEFGTGINYADDHPLASKMGAIRGGYGKGRGNDPYWIYYGEKGTHGEFIARKRVGRKKNITTEGFYITKGNPASRSMYHTSVILRKLLESTAKEVFEDD